MNKEYTIDGMTCNGCVSNVKKALKSVGGIEVLSIGLTPPVATLKSNEVIELGTLQNALGKYQIEEKKGSVAGDKKSALPKIPFVTYKPLVLIILFITGVSVLAQFPFSEFSAMLWMRYFMAGFFIVFSFFKLLNIKGFAEAYKMYDIVAVKWNGWGYIYPFIELALGILYLTNILPIITNIITVLVLGISSIGVIKSNMNKQKIKCACLGDVFNLPMSTVTVIEDVSMVVMATIMLFIL